MKGKIAKFIATFCVVALIPTTAFGYDGHIKENKDIETIMEVNEFDYGGKTSNIETFTFKRTKYVPLRTVANFLGKEVSYDAIAERIDITDRNSGTVSCFSEEVGLSATPKFVDTDIYYNGCKLQDISTEFTNEAKKIGNTSMPIFNYNDKVYVPLKLLTGGLGS